MKNPLYCFHEDGSCFDIETGVRVGQVNDDGSFTGEPGWEHIELPAANSARISLESGALDRTDERFLKLASQSTIFFPDSPVIKTCCQVMEPVDLRWDASSGPITWSLEYSAGFQISSAGVRELIWACIEEIQKYIAVEFQEVQEDAQIKFKAGHIDNNAGIIGQAFLPREGEDMSVCLPVCGTIVFDHSEKWAENEDNFYNTCMHELIHALGVGAHLSDPQNVMFPSLLWGGPRKSLGPGDIAELQKRYPI